jgi:catechol-2,3-dioxygenase
MALKCAARISLIRRQALRAASRARSCPTSSVATISQAMTMKLTGVLRPGHVHLRVLDLKAAVEHFTQVLGLWETARDAQASTHEVA